MICGCCCGRTRPRSSGVLNLIRTNRHVGRCPVSLDTGTGPAGVRFSVRTGFALIVIRRQRRESSPRQLNLTTSENGRLTFPLDSCNLHYMTKRQSINETLRRAVNESELSFLAMERATGVLRQSLMKFARGEQTLRGDKLDTLAKFFGFELVQSKKRRRT